MAQAGLRVLERTAPLMLFCGLALGYADAHAPINRLRTERAEVDAFATFHD